MALEFLTQWLSPGVACFLLLNVLVAAIAFTSRSRRAPQGEGGRAASTRRRLCRSASSMDLDRLHSFSTMFTHTSVEFCYHVPPEAEETEVKVSVAAPDRQLAVPESASISMSRNETGAGVVKSMVSPEGNGTCALVQEGHHAQESMLSSPPPAAAAAVAVVTAAETARVAALEPGPPKDKEEPATTVAEYAKRKHRARVYAVEGKAEFNARAEQFIRQFRQELELQRLDSMLGRHTHTLSTASGAPTSR